MQNSHLVQLLQLMCIEELGTNMLCEVTLQSSHNPSELVQDRQKFMNVMMPKSPSVESFI